MSKQYLKHPNPTVESQTIKPNMYKQYLEHPNPAVESQTIKPNMILPKGYL